MKAKTLTINPESMSRAELSASLRVDPKTISRWTKDGCPRGSENRFVLAEVVSWRIDKADKSLEHLKKAAPGADDWLEAYRKEKTLLARLERRKRRGELMEAGDHEKIMTEACLDLRNTMLSWPSRIFPTDDQNRKMLREEVHRLLEMFARNAGFAMEDQTQEGDKAYENDNAEARLNR
jgi:phage terminase Nu1 subunit (DNA packaging protein)